MNYSELIRNIEHELDEEYEKLGYVFEYKFIPFDRFNLMKEDFSNYSGKRVYKLLSNYSKKRIYLIYP